jgi:hypothetical protein
MSHRKPIRCWTAALALGACAAATAQGSLDQHRVDPAPQDAHPRLKKERVTQSEGTRQDPHRAAPFARHVIDRRLEHAIRGAGEISVFGANADGHALAPIRLRDITGDRARVRVLGLETMQRHGVSFLEVWSTSY